MKPSPSQQTVSNITPEQKQIIQDYLKEHHPYYMEGVGYQTEAHGAVKLFTDIFLNPSRYGLSIAPTPEEALAAYHEYSASITEDQRFSHDPQDWFTAGYIAALTAHPQKDNKTLDV